MSHFFAVDDVVAILILDSRGVQVGASAAGLLGQREDREDGLVGELVHVLGLELRAAVVVEDAPVQVGSVVQVHAHAARAAGELLLDPEDVELRQIPSAVLRGQREAVQVVLDRQIVELLGELVVTSISGCISSSGPSTNCGSA
mgnify:CR=1 FL=1